MIAKKIQEKGILNKLLEQGIRILLIKECKKIRNIKIDIISNPLKIIRGEIQKVNIIAENIEYKDLLFDEVALESNHININFNLKSKQLDFTNNPTINFKILLSENSIRTVLLSKNWNWIGGMISKEILNQKTFEDIRISNGKLLIKDFDENIMINQGEQINIKTAEGKVYLENKTYNRSMQIPIEDKIYIENVKIKNNLITIFANSSISF